MKTTHKYNDFSLQNFSIAFTSKSKNTKKIFNVNIDSQNMQTYVQLNIYYTNNKYKAVKVKSFYSAQAYKLVNFLARNYASEKSTLDKKVKVAVTTVNTKHFL